ncbi:hypothetical protein [Richelia sinica]|nr:hypothetical protein [Richelia sinica]MBD2666572.1 hypothetical protein [Richelia sinica FACHB-800]
MDKSKIFFDLSTIINYQGTSGAIQYAFLITLVETLHVTSLQSLPPDV